MKRRNAAVKHIVLILSALTLCLAFFTNIPDPKGFDFSYDSNVKTTRRVGMHAGNTLFVEIVRNGGLLAEESHVVLGNTYNRNSVSSKTLRILLGVCILALMHICVQYRIRWASERATTRSQQSIIRFIHNKDGQKA